MKTQHLCYALIFTFIACTKNSDQGNPEPPTLYPQPKSAEANPNKKYEFNVVTGDTIQPLIGENGDTIATGVPIKAKGKVIHPDSVEQPIVKVVSPVTESDIYPAYPNRRKIPDDLTVIPINPDSLVKKMIPEVAKGDTTHFIVNKLGDTIPTGIPIELKGTPLEISYPKAIPIQALETNPEARENIRLFNTKNGSPDDYLAEILVGSSGDLWLGGELAGLMRYDGRSVQWYSETGEYANSYFANQSIVGATEDHDGNIWFATYMNGIYKYDGQSFTQFKEEDGLALFAAKEMFTDADNNVWLCSGKYGLLKISGNTATHYTEKEGLSSNSVSNGFCDDEGNIWFGTWKGGVNKYDGASFTHLTSNHGLVGDETSTFTSISQDAEGNMWFGSDWKGLSKFDGKSFTNYTEEQGFTTNGIYSIQADSNGIVWYGTNDGLYKYDGTHFHLTTNDDNMKYLLRKDNDQLWGAAGGNGLNLMGPKSFHHFTEGINLPEDYGYIYHIKDDHEGNIWFGGIGKLGKYDGENFTSYSAEQTQTMGPIIAMDVDDKGNVWLGSWGGLSVFNEDTVSLYTTKQGLLGNNVTSIYNDNKGNVWLGNWRGFTHYDGSNFVQYTEEDGFYGGSINKIIEDSNENIWFACHKGLVKFDGESFTHFTEKEGLHNSSFLDIHQDINGRDIWLSGQKGVDKYDGESFTHFTTKEGLCRNQVRTLTQDQNGNIWANMNEELNKIETLENGEYRVTKFMEQTAAKRNYLIEYGSVFVDQNNHLWWTHVKNIESSIIKMDLATFDTPSKSPLPQLRQIDINEQFMDYRLLKDSLKSIVQFDSIKRFENYPLNLELPYDHNHLTFHFSAIEWEAPEKILYSYRLKGLNNKWSTASTDTKADFRSIPHGTYTFELKAMGESQMWSDSFEYTFKIRPPWWLSWWAKILYILLGLLTLLGIMRWRMRKLQIRQKELETEVENATKEIRNQKEAVEKQKDIIEEVHREITDSINYAERIQRSFLATEELLNENLNEYFVFFKPKEAVSGDFYWAGKLNNGNFAIVNADSTGHGVPGAIMSILNISSIEKAVEKGISDPAEIFNDTRTTIIERLKKDGSPEGGKDGMDASLISLDKGHNKLKYVAAHNPIWIVRNEELIEIKGEKMPVGKHDMDQQPFSGGEFELQKGDIVYTMTDGYQDQFGGEKGKKFKVKALKNLILQNAKLSMQTQKDILNKTFDEWKNSLEQVDDVCLIGIKI